MVWNGGRNGCFACQAQERRLRGAGRVDRLYGLRVGSIVSAPDRVPPTADVVIVGGGIAGASDAFFLGQAGLAVVVVERGEQLAGLTTAQSVACFRAQWDEPDHAALVLPSIDFYGAFAERIGLAGWDIGLRRGGWLFITGAESGPADVAAFVAGHRRLGVHDSEALDGEEARRRFRWLGPDVTAASYRADDGWVSPYEVTYGFARASGATFLLRTTAFRLITDGAGVTAVETDRGTIATRRVVLAGGPFSAGLAATAGVPLPVEALRRHRAMIAARPEIPADGPMTVDMDTHAYWRPEGGGAFLGMGLPEAASEPAVDVPVDWTFPAVAMDAAGRLVPFWRDLAGRLTGAEVSVGAGQYTVTADGRPIIGPTGGIDGLFMHGGDNGWGVESAPEAGRRSAAAVLAGGTAPDDPFRIDRPSLATHAGRTITY
jgi:sarcosine oxidase subunit beta